MAETRPTGEQLRFLSANTGEHVLDTYMEAAEIGGRALSDLLDDLFDPNNSGTFRSENFEFRYNATTSKLQFRAGVFSNSNASFVDVTSFFSVEGAFSTSTSYNNFDLVTVANSDVYIVHGLSSATAFGSESAFISSSNTKKIVDVSGAQAQAAIASDHRADAAKYAVTAEDTSFSLTSTNGGTSGLFSALHYQAKANANATTATTQAGLASDQRADAAKYAVTAHNTTFSLTSTNGGTSGLYSALHYATEASNSASSASGHKDTASNFATAPTTTLSSGSAKAWALGGGSSFTISTAISGSDFSAKYYANQADTHSTTASGHASTANTHKNTASDHKDDAGKYAVTAHNTTFTLTSTNGGTSGLYSALHYATEAANSATAAQNTANAIGNLNSLSDVTISSIANNQFIQYNNASSKFVNVTKSPTITLQGDVTGTGTLTNLGDVTFTTTVVDDSHNHTIANVDNLQTTLNAKSTASKTETLTNKTFDVEGTGNSISNIDVADLKTGVLDTDLSSVSSSDDTLASAKAIKAKLDTKLSGNETITLSGDVSGSGTTSISVTVADDSHNHVISNVDGLQTALNAKAPSASPTLTGTPLAPTAAANTNSTQIATTAYVQTELADLVDSAPGTLDTLNELAAALGDDANFSTTMTNSLATKMPLAGGTFTGSITGTSATFTDNLINRRIGDVNLVVHADTNSGPESALFLQRGANNTFGADGYNDWKIENGYGKSGSAGGTLRIARGYNGSITTFWEWDANGIVSSYANINSSGTLNIEGATGTAQLQVNLTSTTAYNHSVKVFNPNLTQGQRNQILLGESGSNYNTGVFGYLWDSSGSASNNYLEIGHWGNGDVLKVYGDKVEVTEPLTATSITTSGNIELGHASDTTISRASAGVVNINTNAILTTATGATSDDVTALAIALG
tara:strand:+ start:1276 stop:4038 length:2763 start_codon:yes stop_codon:yes gene_type:complete